MAGSRKAAPKIKLCPCCGHDEFKQVDILWDKLIGEWDLSPDEVKYINRQQALTCQNCGSNLRSMNLAAAIMSCYGYLGNFQQFVKNYHKLSVLEVNEAGALTKYLESMKGRSIVSYPKIDLMKTQYKDDTFDLVIHSDTLEHIPDPIKALGESLRILKPGGYTCFTIPIIVRRLSKKRSNKWQSYHGSPGNDEYLVYTEYGGDMWTQLFEAGFMECRLFTIDYPSTVAIIGRKPLKVKDGLAPFLHRKIKKET